MARVVEYGRRLTRQAAACSSLTKGVFRCCKILDEIHCSNFQPKIRNNYTGGQEIGIESIIPSLEVVYCSTTMSNHGSIRLKRFVSQLHLGVMERVFSFIHI